MSTNKKHQVAILTFAIVFCLFRNSQATDVGLVDTSPSANRTNREIKSVSDLKRWVSPGMGTNQIVDHLGQPSAMEKMPDGMTIWRFRLSPFPAGDEMEGMFVNGVTFGITNGHLAHWGCQYVADPQQKTSPSYRIDPSNSSTDSLESIKFFIISSVPLADGKFIDTDHFQKLGWIAKTPNLTISNLLDASWSPKQDQRWAVQVFPNQRGADNLKSFTETNVSKQVLIVVGHEMVSAPTIRAPIEGSLVIEGLGQEQLQSVKLNIANLISRNK